MRSPITMVRPYDAVLCDIDGVLRHWPSVADLERARGFPDGTLARAAFAPARLQPAVTGQATDEQWRAAVTSDIAELHESVEGARALVAAWSAVVPEVDQAVISLLTRVRGIVTVALVSNATSRLESDLALVGLDRLADIVVNSSRVGVAKPDPRIFLLAAEQAGAPPERCLFVDDTEAHVIAARTVGMTAVHYRVVDDLHRALAPLLQDEGALP